MAQVVISGTSRGLGLELVKIHLKEGWRVIGVARSRAPIDHPRYRHLAGDITREDFSGQFSAWLADLQVARVDRLINNAGCGSAGARLSEIEVSVMTEQFKLHCGAALVLIQTLRDRLSSAEIVNITSRLGSMVQHQRGDFTGGDFSYAYRIAKAAQNMLSLCLSDDPELAGCRILSINPGLLQTASGSSDAVYSAAQGARAVLATIQRAPRSGLYHAFGELAEY